MAHACLDRERVDRKARRAAARRADQPPGHRVDPVARGVLEELGVGGLDDLPRPRLHESRRDPARGYRCRRARELRRRLRLLRARARSTRCAAGRRLHPPAGDVEEGATLHRALRSPRRQGRTSPVTDQEARQDREARASEDTRARAVRAEDASTLGQRRRNAHERVQVVRRARHLLRARLRSEAGRTLVCDGRQRGPARRRS